MNAPQRTRGIVLQCDPSGKIIRVIRDDFGITAKADTPSSLVAIVDPESRDKARNFLQAAVDANTTFGWELNVEFDGRMTGLFFIAGVTSEGIMVFASPSRDGLAEAFDEMTKIQSEQLNILRMTLKEEQSLANRYDQRGLETLAQFTSLNNELVNTQRELAQRNAQLAEANAALESLVTIDGLTGLKNHRAFQDAIEQEWTRAERYETPLSLLMLDVDHFKQFNDQFGHPEGDRVLKSVARILLRECRSESLVARYGGEEFAVILPNCDSGDAVTIADRVLRALEMGPWDRRPVTASLGVATRTRSMPNRAALIERADAAMYRAKVGGRNQSCHDCEDSPTAAVP